MSCVFIAIKKKQKFSFHKAPWFPQDALNQYINNKEIKVKSQFSKYPYIFSDKFIASLTPAIVVASIILLHIFAACPEPETPQ